MAPIRLLTFTTLFPNAAQPNHGVFVENRLRHLVATGQAVSTVLAPVPYFPVAASWLGSYGHYATVPRQEQRGSLRIHHPRYPVIPKFGMSAAPFLLFQASLRSLRRLVADGLEFDAIDAHYVYPDGVVAFWLGRRFGKPTVITARGSDVTQLPDFPVPGRLIRGVVTQAAGLVAVSAALRDKLLALGAPRDRVVVLRNGVDTQVFYPADREICRRALGLTRRTLLSVGLLIERKGHARTIEAMTLLPDVDLLIVGEGPDRQRLADLAQRLGIAERVRFLGARPHAELREVYTGADALVLASSREGWANVLLEAMACGTPVVASRIPGNSEVVGSPDAGMIVGANTPEGIAQAVRDLLGQPPDRAATRAYAERFSWDETSEGQLALFRKVIGAPPDRTGG